MAEEKKNIYSNIFVTGDSLDRVLLASLVGPNIRIYENAGEHEIAFTPLGNKLTARQKLIVYLLARKVLWDTEAIEAEGMTPSALEEGTKIPGGTIRPILGKLVKARIMQNDAGKGGYYVPNYSLDGAKEELTGVKE